ncbi:serine protease [Bradyrhizobium septentrionale]|uniref:hypothetical protein n=1 Tax=Bradyrhizobium septentrionale TaxID=1404411 RepID=UPI001596C2C8|nr:hypothetical protein [Bradyrhizobium septentrionale]UGY23077.1 serine protease [Bradyrhizobium septentrionale]
MPRIFDGYLNSVGYLYPSEAEAEDGAKLGGTGFFVRLPLTRPGFDFLCLVTNKHIVDAGSSTVRLNTRDGAFDIIPLDGAKWHYHPDGDDIAICPVGFNTSTHNIDGIHIDNFLTKKIVEQYDIGVGDDAFVVGRFISREGKVRNLPAARFGAIAQMPGEPIVLEGEKVAQESYLIEARSIPGYSGSPVFVSIPPKPPAPSIPIPENEPERGRFLAVLPELYKILGHNQKRNSAFQLGPWLVGIGYCEIFNNNQVYNTLTGAPVPNMYVRASSGMMGVIPAWRVIDVLEGPEIKAIINDLNVVLEREEGNSDSDQVYARAVEENPQHREVLTRLWNVHLRRTCK